MEKALKAIETVRNELTQLSDQIWSFAETSLKEYKSADVSRDYLASKGFRIEENVAGVPTAFTASWGSGKPIIGFLAEYDALPGLSNQACADPIPVKEGAPGHGCGHNLLGVACVGAVLGLKEEMEAQGLSGTIVYYGCPAEENYSAKAMMAKHGLFADVDIAFAYHPGSVNGVQLNSSNANNSLKFTFKGRTAHAGGDPHNGRSALDAVELMNVGSNYLREHVITQARIHYVITDGGMAPNIVPDRAQVWYFVRAPYVQALKDIVERVKKIARGAAMMTETEVDILLESGVWNTLPNEVVAMAMHDALVEVGPEPWDEADLEFARKLSSHVNEDERKQKAARLGVSLDMPLCTEVKEPSGKGTAMAGSTDVADVSWNCPTVMFGTATNPWAIPGHSWMVTASSASSVGHKGMIYAAKAMAVAGLKFLKDPELVKAAKEEFVKATDGIVYESFLQHPYPVFPREEE
jgi:aminobenzoyl-glutamate utilization protein B